MLDWSVGTDEFISCERRKIVGLGLGVGADEQADESAEVVERRG